MSKMNSHILLVEDNPNDVLLTERAFEKVNMLNELKVVSDGQQALDYLFCEGEFAERNKTDLPDVVLLDLNLPKLHGFKVLEAIRNHEKTRYLPVVVMTSSSQEVDIVKCYGQGCNSYIQKPVNFLDFTECAKQLGMYWLLLNKKPEQL